MSISPVIDYWAKLSSLNLASAYLPNGRAWTLETHGSHTVNNVQLVPGAPGFHPEQAYNQWMSLLYGAPSAPPLPTLSLVGSEEGFTATLNIAGMVKMSTSGDLGNFAAGSTLLTQQAALKEGYLTLSANGNTSAATTQYVVLGTGADDSVDFSALASRADYIFGGEGADTIHAGAGDDVVVGGAGNDTITGGAGVDTLYGGDGDDLFIVASATDGAAGEMYDGGTTGETAGDTLRVTGTAPISFADSTLTSIENLDLSTDAGAQALIMTRAQFASFRAIATLGGDSIALTDVLTASTLDNTRVSGALTLKLADVAGNALTIKDTTLTGAGDRLIVDASALTGTHGLTFDGSQQLAGPGFGELNVTGGAAADTISGGAGNDTINGGAGSDTLSGGAGADTFILNASTSGVVTVGQASSTTITFAGAFNVGDVITLQHYSPDPDTFYSYEVRAGDTLGSIASAFAAAIDGQDFWITATAAGSVVTTNLYTNHSTSFVFQASYEADTITDFETGSDVLQLSAATLNRLLNDNPNGEAASDNDPASARGSVTAYYSAGDTAAKIAFRSFDVGSADAAATGLKGTFIYDAVNSKLYLDQSGDTAWTNVGGVLTDPAGDDILLAVVGSITGTDIHIVA